MSNSEEENQEISNEDVLKDDVERTEIRSELSNLSFEELQKLKERIGAKVYNEALFGSKKKDTGERKVFKRENKNRPREMSSKKPVKMIENVVKTQVTRTEARDPRFDPLCGEYNKQEFNSNYHFISNLRTKDIKTVRAELKQTTDPDQKDKLKRLLQRLTEQSRTSASKRLEKEMKQKQKEIIQNALSKGKSHHFMNKSEQRVESLVKQYEELKNEGTARIQRHLKRRQQKVNKKSHRAPAYSS